MRQKDRDHPRTVQYGIYFYHLESGRLQDLSKFAGTETGADVIGDNTYFVQQAVRQEMSQRNYGIHRVIQGEEQSTRAFENAIDLPEAHHNLILCSKMIQARVGNHDAKGIIAKRQ